MTCKTIRILLADGVPTGTRVAEVGNWTARSSVLPRASSSTWPSGRSSSAPGICLLAGPDPESPTREPVYVGESENVLRRLKDEHVVDQSKGFWIRTAIIVSKDDNPDKVHVKYLESRLTQLEVRRPK